MEWYRIDLTCNEGNEIFAHRAISSLINDRYETIQGKN